jgi:hypothetical protein
MLYHSFWTSAPPRGGTTRTCPPRSRPRLARTKLSLQPLEDRTLLSNGLSESLVALGGATPLPTQLPLGLAANPLLGPDVYANVPGPADAAPPFGNEPNTITNFNGFYGGARVQGTGTGSDGHTYLWDADLRVMQGLYRALDGSLQNRTFVEV